ncbi:MAG: hypothetical protein ABEJ31_07985 [Haloarculaceae archaeon]
MDDPLIVGGFGLVVAGAALFVVGPLGMVGVGVVLLAVGPVGSSGEPQVHRVNCAECGAPNPAESDACEYCGSPLAT